jgi:hypothetical protein
LKHQYYYHQTKRWNFDVHIDASLLVVGAIDTPLNSLIDSTASPKVKIMEGKKIKVHFLVHNTLGIEGCVGAPE